MDFNADFTTLKHIIENRRTVKPALMNGKIIPDEQLNALFELANWAPNHGRTEPWRFFVYGGEARAQFGLTHAELYKAHTLEEAFDQNKYDKLIKGVEKVSHVVIVVMKRGSNPKIPALEEISAVSAAVQNLLLGASALGIAAMWNTGGMTHDPALKSHLGLGEEDMVLGILYMGYSDEAIKDVPRRIALSEKVKHM